MAEIDQTVLDAAAHQHEVELTTWGRMSGRPSRVTIWIWGDGHHLYIRSGAGMRPACAVTGRATSSRAVRAFSTSLVVTSPCLRATSSIRPKPVLVRPG